MLVLLREASDLRDLGLPMQSVAESNELSETESHIELKKGLVQ